MLPDRLRSAVAQARLLVAGEVEEIALVLPFPGDLVEVARGGADSVRVTPAAVLRPVLLAGASAFVLMHNHPRGGPPNAADHAVTRRLVAANAVVGVRLQAHLVLAPDQEWDCLGSYG